MNLKRKKFIVFLIIMTLTLGIAQNLSYATNGTLGLKLSYKRYTSSEGWGYALNNGTAHPIYQILAVNGGNVVGTNYFCLDPETSASWNYHTNTDANGNTYNTAGSINMLANYTDYYDLEDKDDLSDLSNFSSKKAIVKNYKQIMWILDNMYVASEDSNQKNSTTGNSKAIEAIMAKAGIVYGDTGAERSGTAVYSYYGDEDNNSYYARYKTNILYANRDANGGYFYINSSGTQENVLLSAEQIEAIEQAAIWYFTNYYKVNDNNTNGDEQYNMYTEIKGRNASGDLPTNNFGDAGWLKYTSGADTNSYNWPLLNSIEKIGYNGQTINEGKMLQEQASILYNYLIDAANDYAAANTNYVANSNPISVTSSKVDTNTVGSNKVIGKFRISVDNSNATPYILDDEIQILDGNGDPISGAKIVNSTGTEISKKAGEMIGTDFYVAVPASSNISKVTVKVTGKYDTTKKLLWLSSQKTEQPIVEVGKTKEPLEAQASLEEDKIFDLALRKAIIGVTTKSGTSKAIINEDGNSATRRITYNVNTLTSGTTATYKHRKDPVVIEEGDIVKYSLTIYNEGSKKGYASEIVDKLPQGLALKGYTENGTTEGTYTSGSIRYTYVYDPSTNKITFTNQSKNVLDVYKNGDKIEEEKIEIECEVTQKPSNTEYVYLTNIAYISKEYDAEVENGDGTTGKEITTEVGADRDSEPAKYPTATQVVKNTTKKSYNGYVGGTSNSVYSGTNNEMYFAGKQDDDDFEVVVMLPKEFDLRLVKYISAVNGDTSKGRTVTAIDTSDLATKRATTAKYTLSKDQVKVKFGDYVTYTFRVYNEGDLDGYVTKLTDNVPLGLQFVQAKGDGKTITIYSYDQEEGLTSKDEEVSSDIYKIVDDNNSYWKIDKKAVASGETVKTDTYDGDTTPSISINVADYLGGTNKLLQAYNASNDTAKDGSTLKYVDVTAVLRVSEGASLDKIIRNEAAITGDSDADGNDVTDRDSQPENWIGKDDHDNYQDDEDYDNVVLPVYDISLRKFITAVSKDMTIESGEYLTQDKTANTSYTRAPVVDTSKLKAGTAKTAIYKHTKEALEVERNDYVLYTIRVYNEGDLDAYASKITDHLPTYLDYIDCAFNRSYGWTATGKTVTTDYLSKSKETATNATILKAFDSENDNGNGSGVSYRDVQILAKVNDKALSDKNITNIAEISEYQNEYGNVVEKDRDSTAGNLSEDVLKQETRPDYNGGEDLDKTDEYIPGQEDDDDFERVVVKRFDLALRKQIVEILNKETSQTTEYKEGEANSRFATLDNKIDNTIYSYYDVEKNIPTVEVNDVVKYSIRVYNEGEIDGTATWVTDKMPTGLEYLPENEVNIANNWKAYKEVTESTSGAVKIGEKYYKEVPFTSTEITLYATDKLKDETIRAYSGTSEADYKEVYMVARVKAKAELANGATYSLRNTAEIGDDSGDDEDSTPGNDSEIKEEDDLDIEDLKLIEYIDKEVQKVWEDSNNQDGIRPNKIALILKKNGTQIDRVEVTPDSNGDWKYKFSKLLKYDENDQEFNYTVEEEAITKYTATYETKADGTVVITNTHKPEEIEVPVKKIWDDSNNKYGKRPEKITVKLYAGEELIKSKEIVPDANGNWEYTFKNLPKYNAGNEITYKVVEDAVKGYVTTYDGYNITNKVIEGKYELDIVKTDKEDNVITDLVSGFSINNGEEQKTVDGVLKFGETQIKETETKDVYEIKEITPPDSYSKFDGTIKIEVAKKLEDGVYKIDVANTTITVYDENGKVLADGNTKSNEIGVHMTATETKVQVRVENERVDLSLRKFITAVSKDLTFEDGEFLTTDAKSKTDSNEYLRAPKVDTSKLKSKEATTAIYNHTKEAEKVSRNDYVLYTIRVYNEGEADVYASSITDHLPTYLDYIDCKFNQNYGWTVAKDGKTVSTKYLSKENETEGNRTILKAFDSENDDGKGSGLSFRDVQILARVNDKAITNKNITNIAEISEYEGKDGSKLAQDRDSKPENLSEDVLKQDVRPDYNGGEDKDKTDNYIPGQEDDDDFERVIVKKFDLALRKQIVSIFQAQENKTTEYNENAENSRFAKLDNSINNTIYSYYDVENNIPTVNANDVVKYSIRVYNEGDVDGTATWVTDKMPTGLEYLAENETNKEYGWKAYKEVKENEAGAIKIGEKYYKEVAFESKEITLYATEYLKDATIKAYTGTGEADYKEVYIVARVKAKSELESGITYSLRNTAEIGDDNGDDEDSTPGNDSEIKKEDDVDIEDLKLPEGQYELDIVKTDKQGNVIKDLVTGFSVNNSAELKTANGVLKLGERKIEDTTSKDVYEIKEITPPDEYSKFDGTIRIEVAKQFKDGKYQIDIANTTIKVYDEKGELLADGVANSGEIGVYMTATTTAVQVNVENERFDLALRKFITAISKDISIDDGEYLSQDTTSKTEYTRAPKVDTSKLKDGTATTAIYKHTKEAVPTQINDYVLYTIRVYNEGEADTYASNITDHLPTYLDYIDCKFNQSYGWTVAKDGKTISTNYLSKEKETEENKTILKAFDSKNDDGKGSGLSFRDVQILVRVNDKAKSNTNITNIAEISEYEGKDGSKLEKDRDSKSGNLSEDILKQDVRPDYNGGEDLDKTDDYIPGQEDDDDFERLIIQNFDLALRKQIVNIKNAYTKQDTKYDDRFAKLSADNKNTLYNYYDVDSNKPQVVANDVVTYSIRVYNEGEVDGTVTWVVDRMPSGLEFLKDDETNKKYGWKAYKEVTSNEDGAVKIGEKFYKEVDFSSSEITLYATEYLKDATIKAYTGEGEADYKEVYVVARVKDKKEVTGKDYSLRNIAEIGDDNGEDNDSTPGNDNNWKEEDDLDVEDLKLTEFDLSLLKYVSTVYVTEDGKTKKTQTNNVGNDRTDVIPKVEIHRKKVNKTVVKFGYTIKITNEGDIAGYAKEITDYVPTGLKFYAEDNKGWTDEGNNVISTRLLESTLLQPGESAQVTVILRWINGNDNLGVKTNTAEISEDYNDRHVPDRDSTPDNKVPGEDDIDDAKVLLSISTGLGENVMMYVGGAIIILVVLGSGIVLIKRFVL